MIYENKTWKLLNVDELPRIKSGANKGKIDYERCIGITLKYELKANGVIYEIKIVDYIGEYRDENNKQIKSNFRVEYVYLKGTEYEEVIEKYIDCNHLINKTSIGGIVPSLNQWIKKEDCWIGKDTKGREFRFNTDSKETEYNILHSTWRIESEGYVSTSKWKMHKVIYFNYNKEEADKNSYMCIDHINNETTDNRLKNLRLVSKAENNKNKNTKNKFGLTGLNSSNKGYYSRFKAEEDRVNTEVKDDLEEAKIDNLIAQRYLGLKHNEDQFYKLEGLSEERIKEVTNWLDKKIEENKNKIRREKEYKYDFIEKEGLIGIKIDKKNENENLICWVDRDFGRIEKEEYIVKGSIYNSRGYFSHTIRGKQYRIHNYVLIGGVSLQNYRNNNFDIDHLNHKPNCNYRDNLEITSRKSNLMNKENKGYCKKEVRYRVYYAKKWGYFDLYIGGLKQPTFNTEQEAIAEVKRRKEIVDKYRFRIGWQGSIEANIKALDKVIDFAEEHDLDIDSAYIVWKGLDTEENIKNYLKDIDK